MADNNENHGSGSADEVEGGPAAGTDETGDEHDEDGRKTLLSPSSEDFANMGDDPRKTVRLRRRGATAQTADTTGPDNTVGTGNPAEDVDIEELEALSERAQAQFDRMCRGSEPPDAQPPGAQPPGTEPPDAQPPNAEPGVPPASPHTARNKGDLSPIPAKVRDAIRETSNSEFELLVDGIGAPLDNTAASAPAEPAVEPVEEAVGKSVTGTDPAPPSTPPSSTPPTSSSPPSSPHESAETYAFVMVPALLTFLNGRGKLANAMEHMMLLEGESATVGTSQGNAIAVTDPTYKDALADIHFEIQVQGEGLYVRAVNGVVSIENEADGSKKNVRHAWQKFEPHEKLSPVFRTKGIALGEGDKLLFGVDANALVPVQKIRELMKNRLTACWDEKAKLIVRMLEEPDRAARVEIRKQLVILGIKIDAILSKSEGYRIFLFESQEAVDEAELVALAPAIDFINKGLGPCLSHLKIKLHDFIERNYTGYGGNIDEHLVEVLAEKDAAFKDTMSTIEDYADATSTFGIPVIIGRDTRITVEQLKNGIYFEIQQKLEAWSTRHKTIAADKEARAKSRFEELLARKQKHREIMDALKARGLTVHRVDGESLEDENLEEFEGIKITSDLENDRNEINLFGEITIGDHPSNTCVLPVVNKGPLRTSPFMARIGKRQADGTHDLLWLEGPFDIGGSQSIDGQSLVFSIDQEQEFRLGPYTIALGKHGYTRKALQEQKAEKYVQMAIKLARGVFRADGAGAEAALQKIRALKAKGLITDFILQGLEYGIVLIVDRLRMWYGSMLSSTAEEAGSTAALPQAPDDLEARLKAEIRSEITNNFFAMDAHLFETLRILGKSKVIPREIKRKMPDEKNLKEMAAKRVDFYCGLLNRAETPQTEGSGLVATVKGWFSPQPDKTEEPAQVLPTGPMAKMGIVQIVRFSEMGLVDLEKEPVSGLAEKHRNEIESVKKLRELIRKLQVGEVDINSIGEADMLALDKNVVDVLSKDEISEWNRAHRMNISPHEEARVLLRRLGADTGRQILRAALEKKDPRREIQLLTALISPMGLIRKDDLAREPELMPQRVDVLLKKLVESAKKEDVREDNERSQLASESMLKQEDAVRMTRLKKELDREVSELRNIAERVAKAATDAHNRNLGPLLDVADLITETTDRRMIDHEIRVVVDLKPRRIGGMEGVERSWNNIREDFYTTACELGRKMVKEVMEGKNLNSNMLMLKMAVKKNLFVMPFLGDDPQGNPLSMKYLEAIAAEKAAIDKQALAEATHLRRAKIAAKYNDLLATSKNNNPADFKYLNLINFAEIKDNEELAIAKATMDGISIDKISALIAAIKAGTATPGMKLGGKMILRKGFNPAAYGFNPADIDPIK